MRCELEAPGERFGIPVSAYLSRQFLIEVLPSQTSLQKPPSLPSMALSELSRIALLILERSLAFGEASTHRSGRRRGNKGIQPYIRPW